MVTLRHRETYHHIFTLDANHQLHMLLGDNEGANNDYGEEDAVFAMFKFKIPSPRFAVTAPRFGTTTNQNTYIYYQENGTHLAEIAFENGYWVKDPRHILIP